VRAYGGPQFQVTQTVLSRFAEAIQQAGVDVVPRIMIGGKDGSNGSIMEALMAMLLSERLSTGAANQVNARPKRKRCWRRSGRACRTAARKDNARFAGCSNAAE